MAYAAPTHEPLFAISQRLPPSNIPAEQALIGALLANNSAYDRVSEFLEPHHFADPVHGRIYQAIKDKIEKGAVADAVTLNQDFLNSGILDEVGGTRYLAQLLTAMVGIISAGEYGKAIQDAWIRRQVIAIAEDTVNQSFGDGSGVSGEQIVDECSQKLSELSVGGISNDGVTLTDAMQLAVEEGEEILSNPRLGGARTGLSSLDNAILGLRPGNLLVIGGRPSMGKTALAKTISLTASRLKMTEDGEIQRGHMVAFFCLEESKVDFGASAISQLSGVPMATILNGTASVQEADRIIKAQQRYRECNLHIFDKPRETVVGIARECRKLMRKTKTQLRLVVVDYLQLMKDPPGIKEKRLAVGQNSYGLKVLARELNCAVIVLSQLGRQVDDRPDHRPTMRDLRETSEIEDNADVIIFPYREARYFELTRPMQDHGSLESIPTYMVRLAEWQSKLDLIKDQAQIIIPKNKRGPAPVVLDWRFVGPATRFEERHTSWLEDAQ
jgi:replicative DNA helicase